MRQVVLLGARCRYETGGGVAAGDTRHYETGGAATRPAVRWLRETHATTRLAVLWLRETHTTTRPAVPLRGRWCRYETGGAVATVRAGFKPALTERLLW